jgi:hypothetical protein
MAGSFQREAYPKKLSNERKMFHANALVIHNRGVPGEPSGFSYFEGQPAKSVALEPFRQLAKGSAIGAVVHSPGAKLFAANRFVAPNSYGGFDSLKAVCGFGPNAE